VLGLPSASARVRLDEIGQSYADTHGRVAEFSQSFAWPGKIVEVDLPHLAVVEGADHVLCDQRDCARRTPERPSEARDAEAIATDELRARCLAAGLRKVAANSLGPLGGMHDECADRLGPERSGYSAETVASFISQLRDCLATRPINRIVNQAPLCTAFDYYRSAGEVSDKRRDISTSI
jgi:hypothetical protein